MALYLVRAGRNGEFENRFIDENRVYLHWGDLFADRNIAQIGDYDAIKQAALTEAPDEKPKAIINGVSQINTFVHRIAQGDWVVLPLKHKSAIAVGKIISAYTFNISNDEGFRHYRDVEWMNSEIPRSVFEQDLLYSFGAFMTICQVQRNDAENRLKALASANWQRFTVTATPSEGVQEIEMGTEDFPDYEILAMDQITALIARKFKGHAMERLVEGILNAQGYKTWRTSGGADGNMDILAAPDSLGFGIPRICVQVKSQDTPVDRPTLDQLRGGMNRSKATHGLLVSWGGFKNSVEREIPHQFFEVRLWDRKELIVQLLSVYDKIDADLRAELPLKRVWMVTLTDNI
jgi:restriction system protein